MKKINLASVILGLVERCDGYRILGMFPSHGKSHFMMYEALMEGLARMGHQINVVSTFPQKTPYPNYTDLIHLPLVMSEFVNNVPYQKMQKNNSSILSNILEYGKKIFHPTETLR